MMPLVFDLQPVLRVVLVATVLFGLQRSLPIVAGWFVRRRTAKALRAAQSAQALRAAQSASSEPAPANDR